MMVQRRRIGAPGDGAHTRSLIGKPTLRKKDHVMTRTIAHDAPGSAQAAEPPRGEDRRAGP
jgi:hypothetical protein